METENITKLFGGILLIVVSLILAAPNIGSGVCKIQDLCPIAWIITFGIFSGFAFIIWAFWDKLNLEE